MASCSEPPTTGDEWCCGTSGTVANFGALRGGTSRKCASVRMAHSWPRAGSIAFTVASLLLLLIAQLRRGTAKLQRPIAWFIIALMGLTGAFVLMGTWLST